MASSYIFFVFSIMLLASIVGFIFSKQFKQPISVGIIVIGIILGPSLLGLVNYDGVIAVIAQLGSIILLFIAGLHSNINEVYTKKNFYIAVFGALLPVIGGFFVGLLFDYSVFTSIFIGATLSATCLGITSSVLKELGKIKTETAKAMIGAAVIDDIISLSLLSIILSVPTQVGMGEILLKILMILGFIFLMLLFGQTILTYLVDKFNDKVIRIAPRLTFVLGLAIVFLFSYISDFLGLAPIVGAFLIGISLAKSRSSNTLLIGSEYFELVFTAVFFIVIGAVVEIGAFISLFWLIIALTIVAIATKMIGSGLIAYKLGFNKKDATIIGVGMSPRGEVAFIIALNGLLLGVITKEVYSAIVFMSFFTTVAALVVLKHLYKGKRGEKEIIDEEVDFIELKIKR